MPNGNTGRKASKEAKENMRKAHLANPTKYWLGKKRVSMLGDKNPAKKEDVREKISKATSGEKNHSWNKNREEVLTKGKIRTSSNYRAWRKACLERDNFTCQKTGINGGDLVIHHLNNFSEFPELIFSIDNGITLNEKVHIEFHKMYGFKNNTKEQMNEFLIK